MKELIAAYIERYKVNTKIKCCHHRWITMHKREEINKDICSSIHLLIACSECGETKIVEL
jgi:hypothetical protein